MSVDSIRVAPNTVAIYQAVHADDNVDSPTTAAASRAAAASKRRLRARKSHNWQKL